jgi:hypothetical protein
MITLVGPTPENVEIYSRAHSFIDAEIFLGWFRDTFVPDLVARPAHHGRGFDTLCQAQKVVPGWLLIRRISSKCLICASLESLKSLLNRRTNRRK